MKVRYEIIHGEWIGSSGQIFQLIRLIISSASPCHNTQIDDERQTQQSKILHSQAATFLSLWIRPEATVKGT